MDKIETIKSFTKGDINDLKAYANAIGVKCENCIFLKEYICKPFNSYMLANEFCSRFKSKKIPKTKD